MSQNLLFGYFNLQGRGQIARLLLAYTRTQYKEVRYSFSKFSEWADNDKINLGLDFPSLPYLIDGKLKLTESKAIEMYIIHRAKKASEMLGKNNKQRALINNIDGVIRQVFNSLIGLFFAADFQAQRKRIYPSIQQKLNLLNKFIGDRNIFLNRITYVDFLLTVTYSYLQLFYPHEFSIWNNLRRVAQYINCLPDIVSYYQSPGAISDLIAPEKVDLSIFSNIQPIHKKQVQPQRIQVLEEGKKDQQSQDNFLIKDEQLVQKNIENEQNTAQKLEPTQHYEQTLIEQSSNSPQQGNTEKINQTVQQEQQVTPVQQAVHHLQATQIQASNIIKRTQSSIEQTLVEPSVEQQRHFNTRVQQYQKAAEATNTVQYSQFKVDMEKSSIVTPSKIGSSIKSNGTLQASWKIFTQNKQNNQLETKKSSITLGYWGNRGLGQIQRHLLTYCGHQFTQKIYKTREEWVNADKQSLNLPFPNLPYLITGDLRLTQSLAIDRYIIRTSERHELLGKNLLDQTLIQNIVKILSEIFKQIRVFCFTTEQIQQKKAKIISKIDVDFKRMNDFIQDKQFAFGYLTWTDFYIAQISNYIQKIFPQIYVKYQFLKNINESLNKINEVKKYYEKESSIKGPFMPPTAKIFF